VAIDDEQQRELNFLISEVMDGRLLGTVVVRSNPSGRPTKTGYSVAHEYLIFGGRGPGSAIGRMPPTEDQMARFSEQDAKGPYEWRNLRREGSNSDRDARRALYYPIYINKGKIRVPRMSWDELAQEWIVEEQPKPGEQVVLPDNEDGVQKTWRWEWETVMDSLAELTVRKDRSGRDYVYYKRRMHEEGVVSISCWFDPKYSATEHGTAVLKDMFGKIVFPYPKSIFAVSDSLYVAGASKPDAIVMDFFAGSGTTGQAVISLNRRDGGSRKFLLVEMGEYFETVLVPRIKKAIYSDLWADGKPASRETGVSHFLKYIRIESFEDTLNNLDLRRSPEQATSLGMSTWDEKRRSVREDYVLGYMLDVESRESILNVSSFEDPFNYVLKVVSEGDTKRVTVDLVETFNWLIGLRVRTVHVVEGVRVVTGENPDGEEVLVLWRNVKQMDNDKLDAWFKKQGFNARDQKYDVIYVNGDNNLENLREPDQTWKVRLTETEFHRLMFDVEDV
jgi:adenine-specific DNA-methyltransferase